MIGFLQNLRPISSDPSHLRPSSCKFKGTLPSAISCARPRACWGHWNQPLMTKKNAIINRCHWNLRSMASIFSISDISDSICIMNFCKMKERSDCFKIDQFSDYMHDQLLTCWIQWGNLWRHDEFVQPTVLPRPRTDNPYGSAVFFLRAAIIPT